MKNKKKEIFSILLAGLLLVAGLSGCTAQDETSEVENTPETITVTDGFGREVTIEKPVETAVSGISIITEMMTSLGLKDRIVAIDIDTSMNEFLFGDTARLPVIQTDQGNHYAIDIEAVITLEPDIFVIGVVPQEGLDDIIADLSPDIPVIALSYDTPEEIVASVELLGTIFDCEDAADEYVEFFQGTVDMITERVAGIPEDEKPVVYYEWLQYFTFNKELNVYQNQIALSGGINAAADMPTTYGTIDPEWVIEKDPDIFVAMAMPYSYMGSEPVDCGYEIDDASGIKAYRESILNRSELSEVTAIKEGRVYIIHYELPTTSCIGFAYMAKWLYPELFEDLDPQAIHQEYLTRFMRIDYDLSEHGVFVYPNN